MGRPSPQALAAASAGLVVVAFLLTWAQLDVIRETSLERQIAAGARRSLSKTFGGRATSRKPGFRRTGTRMPTIPTQIRGFQIPVLANRRDVKVAAQFMALFTKKRESFGLMSWLVYAVPGVALACGVLLATHRLPPWGVVMVAVVCAAIAIGGGGMLLATDTRKQFTLVIREGVWLSLLGYLGLAIAAMQSRRRAHAL